MYKLYLDESGKNTLTQIKDWMPHFSIGGALVHERKDEFIRERADQIKFKYWGHSNVTFRGNNIRRLDEDFAIFKDVIDPQSKKMIKDNSQLRNDFYADFQKYIEVSKFQFIWVCVNKKDWITKNPQIAHAIAQNWDKTITSFEKQLTRNVVEEVIKIYTCYLAQENAHGQIIVEASDITQDGDVLAIYNQFMFNGLPSMGMTNIQVRDRLTCISFATKNNRDHETQLADLGSHFLHLQARVDDKVPYKKSTQFEDNIIRAFQSKAFVDSCNAAQNLSTRRL